VFQVCNPYVAAVLSKGLYRPLREVAAVSGLGGTVGLVRPVWRR
jgi:hypothetical protein